MMFRLEAAETTPSETLHWNPTVWGAQSIETLVHLTLGGLVGKVDTNIILIAYWPLVRDFFSTMESDGFENEDLNVYMDSHFP